MGFITNAIQSIFNPGHDAPKAPPQQSFEDVYKRPTPEQILAIKNKLAKYRAPAPLNVEFIDGINEKAAYQGGTGWKGMAYQPGAAYQERDFSKALPEYEFIRNKVSQQANARTQIAQDALQRRFAAMGALNSGAYIKQASNLDQQQGEQTAQELGDVAFNEAQARRGLQEQEYQRAFGAGETEKQRAFGAGETEKQRFFQSGETEAQRRFESGESAAQRTFGKKEGIRQRNFQRQIYDADAFTRAEEFKITEDSKLAALDLGWRNAIIEAIATGYNSDLSSWQAQNSGGLLGAGGFLGTGIKF